MAGGVMSPKAYELPEPVPSVGARGTIQLLAGRGFLIFSGYLVSIILARGLGPVEYGVYGVILSVLVWMETLGNAGIPAATAKLIPLHEGQASAVEQAARIHLLIVSLVIFTLCWFLAPSLARVFGIPAGATLFRVAILDIPFSGLYFAYQGVFYGHQRFGALSLCFIVYSLTKLFGIATLFVLQLSVLGALVVNLVATAGALIYLVIKSPPTCSLPSGALLGSMLRAALPLGVCLLSTQLLLSVDLWSLKSLWSGGGELIGIYVAAINVSKILLIVPSVIAGILFARLSWALARHDEALARSCIQEAGRLALIILMPSCTLIALHSETIMVLIYSSVYAAGGILLSLQVIAFGLLAFFDISFNALMASGKAGQSAGILLVLVPVAFALNLVLIPKFGAMGAASSLLITICLGTMVGAVVTYRRFGSLIRLATFGRASAATAVMTLASSQIPIAGAGLVMKLIVLLGFYFVVLSLLKEFSREDLNAFAFWRGSRTVTKSQFERDNF
jgi:O-antigen/teichoic acid export membrane protein